MPISSRTAHIFVESSHPHTERFGEFWSQVVVVVKDFTTSAFLVPTVSRIPSNWSRRQFVDSERRNASSIPTYFFVVADVVVPIVH